MPYTGLSNGTFAPEEKIRGNKHVLYHWKWGVMTTSYTAGRSWWWYFCFYTVPTYSSWLISEKNLVSSSVNNTKIWMFPSTITEVPCVEIQVFQYVVCLGYFVILDCTDWCLWDNWFLFQNLLLRWLLFYFVNITDDRIIWEKGTATETMFLTDGPVDMSLEYFIHYWLICKGPPHCGELFPHGVCWIPAIASLNDSLCHVNVNQINPFLPSCFCSWYFIAG